VLALARRTSPEVSAIEASADWFEINVREGRHIVSSLRKERFLPIRRMRKIQEFFLGADWSDLEKAIKAYQSLCYDHTLRGGPIRIRPVPEYVGRAVEEKALVEAVFRANGGTMLRKRIGQMLRRQAFGLATRADLAFLATLKMAPYGTWVTWDAASNGRDDPFVFSVLNCADQIRASLGLSMSGRRQPIFLMVYRSAGVPALLRPTCADAGIDLRFAPPPKAEDKYGLTKPWEEIPDADPAALKGLVFNPRPEAVHSPATFPIDFAIRRRGSRVVYR
jgi:hypothetical protein